MALATCWARLICLIGKGTTASQKRTIKYTRGIHSSIPSSTAGDNEDKHAHIPATRPSAVFCSTSRPRTPSILTGRRPPDPKPQHTSIDSMTL